MQEVSSPNERLMRLLTDLEALRRTLRLYPRGHPGAAPAQQRLRTTARSFHAGERLAFAVGPGRLVVQGQEQPLPHSSPAERLLEILFRLAVAGVVLEFPAAEEGLVVLAEALAGVREEVRESDRTAVVQAAERAAGVDLKLLDLSLVERGDGDSQAHADLLSQLLERVLHSGAFPLPDHVRTGDAAAAGLAAAIADGEQVESLVDFIFRQLAEMLPEDVAADRLRLGQLRALLGELLPLLAEDRRHLAILAAATHLPPEVFSIDENSLTIAGLLLDAVEHSIQRAVVIHPAVVRTLRVLAAGLQNPDVGIPPALAARAQALLVRLEAEQAQQRVEATEPDPPVPTDWEGRPWATELCQALTENASRLELGRRLAEAISLWPQTEVAEAAALRLAAEFVSALETGDLESARRFASIVAAQPFAEARELAIQQGVRAAVAALHDCEDEDGATVVAILAALGVDAVPALLAQLAEEEHTPVRKRLLEAILHHGPAAAPAVRRLLGDPRWYVARNAVFLLRKLGDRDSIPEIRSLLSAAAPAVRAESLKALVALQDHHWMTYLLKEIDSPDDARRQTALEVAAHIPDPRLVAALIRRLRERVRRRRRGPATLQLIQTLKHLGHPAALPVLEEIAHLRQWLFPFSVEPLREEAAAAIASLRSRLRAGQPRPSDHSGDHPWVAVGESGEPPVGEGVS